MAVTPKSGIVATTPTLNYEALRAGVKRGKPAATGTDTDKKFLAAEKNYQNSTANGRALTALKRAFPAEYAMLFAAAKAEVSAERTAFWSEVSQIPATDKK